MATLAQLARFARQGGTPAPSTPVYNPTAYAYTLEQALQPTGMQTAFGDPYIGSRWTRFNQPPPGTSDAPAGTAAISGFQNARNAAFQDWAQKIAKQLGGEVSISAPGQTSAILPHQAQFNVGGVPVKLTLWHYDNWTKEGVDPKTAVLQMAASGTPASPQPQSAGSAINRLSRVARSVDLASKLRKWR